MPAKQSSARGETLRKLFFGMLLISACTFGGGYVIVTFMKRRFVDDLGWISEEEMLDMTAIAQSSPGAIAVNAAVLLGWRTAGFAGMLAAVAGTVIPPGIILSVVSLFYTAFASNPYVALVLRGMQAGVAAVIMDVVYSMGAGVVREKSLFSLILMGAAFAAAMFTDVNVVLIVLAAAAAGIVRTRFQHGKKGGAA